MTMTMKEARAALKAHGVTPLCPMVDIYDAIHEALFDKYPGAQHEDMTDLIDKMCEKVAE
jgi:hypothetical protein